MVITISFSPPSPNYPLQLKHVEIISSTTKDLLGPSSQPTFTVCVHRPHHILYSIPLCAVPISSNRQNPAQSRPHDTTTLMLHERGGCKYQILGLESPSICLRYSPTRQYTHRQRTTDQEQLGYLELFHLFRDYYRLSSSKGLTGWATVRVAARTCLGRCVVKKIPDQDRVIVGAAHYLKLVKL